MEHPWPRREPNLKCADRNLWCGSKRSLPLMVPEQNQLRKQSPHFRRESFLQRKPISCTSWKAIETHLCFNGFFGVEVWTNTFSALLLSFPPSQVKAYVFWRWLAWSLVSLGLQVKEIHQGKSRWHSYLVLVYISHVLTDLLGTVPYILTMGQKENTNPVVRTFPPALLLIFAHHEAQVQQSF